MIVPPVRVRAQIIMGSKPKARRSGLRSDGPAQGIYQGEAVKVADGQALARDQTLAFRAPPALPGDALGDKAPFGDDVEGCSFGLFPPVMVVYMVVYDACAHVLTSVGCFCFYSLHITMRLYFVKRNLNLR